MNRALTVAGSDSGGGAGIQADLKTFSSFNVHGMAAITSITAQNTQGISAITDVPIDMIKKQIECVAQDIHIDAAKTGMLHSKKIIQTVVSLLKKYEFPVIVDPIMIAGNETYILSDDSILSLINSLIPLAYVITPNKYEAEKLTGFPIKNRNDVRKAAKEIKKMGVEAVIIKGGHIGENSADVLYYKKRFTEYKTKRIKGFMHGAGCSFSAAITANVAKGYKLEKAVEISKNFITTAIQYREDIGHGSYPVNPSSWILKDAEKWRVFHELKKGVNTLLRKNISKAIPEVGMNFAYALPHPYTKNSGDVAAIEGRIVRAGKKPRGGEIKFGASHHLSRVILKLMEYDMSMRAVLNLKYDKKLLQEASEKWILSSYDRSEEPKSIKKKEGETMLWGIETAIKKAGKVPDIIYHEGDIGKEPMILILGKSPVDVLKKFDEIWKYR